MGNKVSNEQQEQVQREHNLTQEQMNFWLEGFRKHSSIFSGGKISRRNFTSAFSNMPQSQEIVDKSFKTFDKDDNGDIDFTEFMFGVLKSANVPTEVKLNYAFDMLDLDGNQYIELHELREVVESMTPKHLLKENRVKIRNTFADMDENGDDKVDRNEFMQGALNKCNKWLFEILNLELSDPY